MFNESYTDFKKISQVSFDVKKFQKVNQKALFFPQPVE